ncbi:MAG: hypothetical protein M0C28_24990 [Candidatus Moduliflexus flocculans]|nr:hypothetical protein [Candidatus Moduliflexus flocculans]
MDRFLIVVSVLVLFPASHRERAGGNLHPGEIGDGQARRPHPVPRSRRRRAGDRPAGPGCRPPPGAPVARDRPSPPAPAAKLGPA